MSLTDRLTHMATLRTRRSRGVRNTVLSMIGRIPVIPRQVATELAGLRNRERPQKKTATEQH